jgi:hypothetical protein
MIIIEGDDMTRSTRFMQKLFEIAPRAVVIGEMKIQIFQAVLRDDGSIDCTPPEEDTVRELYLIDEKGCICFWERFKGKKDD